MEVKKEYKSLLDEGELKEMFPQLTGSWKEDKELFVLLWEENQKAIRNINVDFDEYEEL